MRSPAYYRRRTIVRAIVWPLIVAVPMIGISLLDMFWIV